MREAPPDRGVRGVLPPALVKAIEERCLFHEHALPCLLLVRIAQQCCDSYGLSLHGIRAVCNKLAW